MEEHGESVNSSGVWAILPEFLHQDMLNLSGRGYQRKFKTIKKQVLLSFPR